MGRMLAGHGPLESASVGRVLGPGPAALARASVDILKTLACYQLISPGSEWRLHRQWFDESAMGDLLGEDAALALPNNLYRCLDKLTEHKKALFTFLRERWKDRVRFKAMQSRFGLD